MDEATIDKEFDVRAKGLLEKLDGARLQPPPADENGKLNNL